MLLEGRLCQTSCLSVCGNNLPLGSCTSGFVQHGAERAMASFNPRMGSLTLVPADCQTVRFLALPDTATPEGQLQVWTDLNGEWRAYNFEQQSTSEDLMVVDVSLARSSSIRTSFG